MKKLIRIIIDILASCVAVVLGGIGCLFFAFGYWAQTISLAHVIFCLVCMGLCFGAAAWILERVGRDTKK